MTTAPPAVTVEIPGRSYAVHFEPLATLAMHLRETGLEAGPALVVTDETVGPLYLDAVCDGLRPAGWRTHGTAVPAGEGSKGLGQVSALYDWALGLGIGRRTPVLALGGGVVGDLAGFAAATLLRGLPLVHLPTTVIAQVDSAIGGKTGVNHAAGKNLVGAFHQPRLVLADPATLATLPPREVRSGLAEAVKHALVADAALLDRLESEWPRLWAGDVDALGPLLRDAAAVKARIVAADVLEADQRAVLNFGHTFGHAVEREAGYGRFTHGEAVAVGMRAALHLSASVRDGAVAGDALPEPFGRAERAVARLSPPPLDGLTNRQLVGAMTTDKKRTAEGVRFVVLDRLGAARLADGVPEGWVEAAWDFARAGARSG